jgi:hypothetical protein
LWFGGDHRFWFHNRSFWFHDRRFLYRNSRGFSGLVRVEPKVEPLTLGIRASD